MLENCWQPTSVALSIPMYEFANVLFPFSLLRLFFLLLRLHHAILHDPSPFSPNHHQCRQLPLVDESRRSIEEWMSTTYVVFVLPRRVRLRVVRRRFGILRCRDNRQRSGQRRHVQRLGEQLLFARTMCCLLPMLDVHQWCILWVEWIGIRLCGRRQWRSLDGQGSRR